MRNIQSRICLLECILRQLRNFLTVNDVEKAEGREAMEVIHASVGELFAVGDVENEER